MLRTYQPKKRQRKKEHGFRKRMSSASGRAVLKRSPAINMKSTFSCSEIFNALTKEFMLNSLSLGSLHDPICTSAIWANFIIKEKEMD